MKPTATPCVLCADEGGTLIWKNEALRVVLVDDGGLPGYTRVIWHAHVREMTELDAIERHLLMRAVFVTEQIQRDVLKADKINLASLGNMTPHLHWHIMPRWEDDPWFPASIWAAQCADDAGAKERWNERRQAVQAILGKYACTLHAELERLHD